MKTLYENGKILTMESPWPAEALVEEEGKVRFVGRREEALTLLSPGDKRKDLCGHTLMPGFVDGHSHLTGCASALSMVQLGGCQNYREITERIESFIREQQIPAGKWVCATGYDHTLLAEKRHPTRELLDIFSQNPVVITHQSGHMGVVNRLGLQEMGIKPETSDPEGGHIGRDDTGVPNGYLEETAFTQISQVIPPPPEEERIKAIQKAEEEYLRQGFTTIQDGLIGEKDWEILRRMDQARTLRADVVCYHSLKDIPYLSNENPAYDRRYGNHLKLGGYKVFLDGSPQGKTAWLSQPYEGEKEYRGYPAHSDQQVFSFMKQALEDNRQILVHCNGDAAAAQMIDCYRRALAQTGCPGIRPVMIHAQTVRRDQLREMASLSMMASFFVAHVFHWGDVHLQNLGERGREISPLASAAQTGVCFTLHQDSPVLPPDMWESIWCAAVRVTRQGEKLEPRERIPVYEALKAATINGACQYFEEGEKGSLRPGKRADMIVVDRHPLECPAEALREVQVLETIKDGKTVWCKEK